MPAYDPHRLLGLPLLFVFRCPAAAASSPLDDAGLAANRRPPHRVRPGREVVELVLSGRGSYQDGGRPVVCGPGDLLWHRAGDVTLGRHDPADPYCCLALRLLVDPASPCPAPRRSHWADLAHMAAFAREAVALWSDPAIHRSLLLHHLCASLLCVAQRGDTAADTALPAALARMRARIEADFRHNLSVADLAVSAGCPPQRLHEMCQEHLGSTPHRLIQERRLREVRAMLGTGDLGLREIAEVCGFASPATLCRAFRRSDGLSPMAWRRRHR